MEKKTELQQNAIRDARRQELTMNQRTMDMQWLNSRMEDGRMGRLLSLIKREAEMEKEYQERTDHASIVNAKVARETALAFEIAKAQREETAAYQRRHYLRERDPGLRTLTNKLKAAYVCRDLQQQIRNNQYKKLQEKAEENKVVAKLAETLYGDQEYRKVEERNKAERVNKYCQELQQQLVSRQMQRQCQYEDTLIEKKMLDEIIKTIADEDQREVDQKRVLVEKTRREMVTFKQAQEAWRTKQKQIVLAEEKELERQRVALADRQAEVIAERQLKLKKKDELNKRIADEILADQVARQERQDIVRLLQEQEGLEAMIQNDIREREKRERMKRETKEALIEQMAIKKQQEAKEREVNANYLKQLKQKMADEEAKEAEKQRLIREKNKLHCTLLLKQAEEQRQKNNEKEKSEEARANFAREFEQKWINEVAKERAQIVKEHVPKVLGYLQAGVIKKTDLQIVREGANMDPELAKLNIEALTLAKRPKRFAKCNAQCRIIREY